MANTQVEAQDMITGRVYTDGKIVFRARKIRAFGDKGVRITTGMGKFIYATIEQSFISIR